MDEQLTEQDLFDLGINFDEQSGMYKLSKVLFYDLTTRILYCRSAAGTLTPISSEIKSRQDILDLYALLFNK